MSSRRLLLGWSRRLFHYVSLAAIPFVCNLSVLGSYTVMIDEVDLFFLSCLPPFTQFLLFCGCLVDVIFLSIPYYY